MGTVVNVRVEILTGVHKGKKTRVNGISKREANGYLAREPEWLVPVGDGTCP